MNHKSGKPQQEAGAVESVVIALQKVIALLDRIKNAIEESSSKIPKASLQLNTVTQATEVATVEILNRLETMNQRLGNAEQTLGGLSLGSPLQSGQSLTDAIARDISSVKEDVMSITMALQVQDITAQRIAAVTHLIDTVRLELLRELSYLEADRKSPENPAATPDPSKSIGPQVFDRNASYTKPAELQERIDKVVQGWREKRVAV